MEASELNKILDQHQLWLDGKGGKCANLTYADLSGASLKSASLKSVNLKSADLYEASLTDANLNGANLKDADLRGANLHGADLTDANLRGADLSDAFLGGTYLSGANLVGAYLCGANLNGKDLKGAILPDISWIIPGCLVQMNHVKCGFYLEKERKWEDFVQDSFGFFIQNNVAEGTFDILVEDRVIRGIPDWVKYSGLKQIESESV